MVLLPWRWVKSVSICPHLVPGRCPHHTKARLWHYLTRLLLVAVLLLVLAVVAAFTVGPLEEWFLRPGVLPPHDWEGLGAGREGYTTFDWRGRDFAYQRTNAAVCAGNAPFLVGLVVSKPAHWDSRRAIRESWGSVQEVAGHTVRTLFALGHPSSPQEQELIDQEAETYRDVVQGRFQDSYLNLTRKTLMILHWFTSYCPQSQFLLKVDDDVFLNYHRLVGLLLGPGLSQDLYLGRVHRKVRAIRDPSSLFYVPESVFRADTYPDYCSGTSYVLSASAARKVYRAALSLPLLPIEDVFVGISAQRAGVAPTHTSMMSGSLRFHFRPCCYRA
ncbi:hypothetical protein chiPu_0028214, partial [Chiloscyllium punctatum]|nr:hypothetical protein [Chiloscyllium punctatum]